MRSITFLLRCIKDGIVGLCGGSPPQKSGLIGLAILFIYFLIVGLIIVVTRSAQTSAELTLHFLLRGTAKYCLLLLGGALLVDFIRHIWFKK